MKINLFRIIKSTYIDSALTGEGAKLYGGRWNSKGNSVIYTSHSLSLATLELLVNLEDYNTITSKYSYLHLEIDHNYIDYMSKDKLPHNWNSSIPTSSSQSIGDIWIQNNTSLVLGVPSAVIDIEYNFLINPNHADFNSIKIVVSKNFKIDSRL